MTERKTAQNIIDNPRRSLYHIPTMNITWNLLTSWMLGRSTMPVGWSLAYEFRPSLTWHVNLHEACRYWQHLHPEQHRTEFWRLSIEEREEWGKKLLQEKYKTFTNRPHYQCIWQQFTLTSDDGKTIILQMDSHGSVKQLEKVKKLVEIEEWIEIH